IRTMAKITLPDEFQRSYMSFREYPSNAILRGTTTYRMTLQPLKEQLGAIESDLCLMEPDDYKKFEVPIRDLHTASGLGRRDIQERFKEMTGKDGRPEDKSFDTIDDCLRSSLAAHLLYSHWSTEGWRWYIRWLEGVIDTESSMAIYGPRGRGYAHKDYKPYDIQDLQYWLDKTSEAIMVMGANVDVISALQRFYFSLRENKDFPDILKQSNADDI
ncbi:hypothetical protein AOQ84DRAFT_266113, partial [Glonium stellatum]